MQRVSVFALPSRCDGLASAHLEASHKQTGHRMPWPGIAEIIQHGSNSLLVGADNEKELSIAISVLLRDESYRSNLGTATRDTILDGLTLTHQAESLARIYRESIS
jgi:glycosyltransferase involved in cell wall biosynthesis